MTKENTSSSLGVSILLFAVQIILIPIALMVALAHIGWIVIALAHFLGHSLDQYMRGDELWRTRIAVYAQVFLTIAYIVWDFHCKRISISKTQTDKLVSAGLFALSGLVSLWWIFPVLF